MEKGVTPPKDWNDIDQVRTAKKREIGIDCQAAIYAGIELDGRRYSLTAHDQAEITARLTQIRDGAAEVPYHADGELCRMFTADEFKAVAGAAAEHILYHRTYCNHLNAWIKRASMPELRELRYGADLPEDLAAGMAKLLSGVVL